MPDQPVAVPGPADPVVSPADTIRQAREAFVQYIALKIPEGFPLDRWLEYEAAVDALLAVGERDKAEIEGLKAELALARDRAVCSGCGSEVGESGFCPYPACEDGEMIPASDLAYALRVKCDQRVEEQDEWRDEWDELKAAGERDRQHIARQAAVLKDLCDWAEGLTIADWGARFMAIVDDAAAVLADKEDAGNG